MVVQVFDNKTKQYYGCTSKSCGNKVTVFLHLKNRVPRRYERISKHRHTDILNSCAKILEKT